ncbi:peptidylprolyl isomerase [Malikia sp.]|uniref:peptidylprolyl isomerase n=1 Tax=Malikia sp. TaxID=2070706 RepID=UPI0026045CCE|nr:peptidylprolyl isomerase [Malikia sp.]MDD2727639.1 peptidylprolyl isomerase [Malikia sp.]
MKRRHLNRLIAGTALALAAALPALAQNAAQPPAAQRVKLETSLGNIVLELDAQKAPKTVANFVQYVKDKHYDGTVFHRVIDGFMIQGGGFTAEMQQKPTRASIPNEADNGLKNIPLTVAMARTNDPHSASAQFFINIADNRFLNHTQPTQNGWGYAVFGKVIAGADVVDKIRQVRTGSRGMFENVPTTPVTILKATLEK